MEKHYDKVVVIIATSMGRTDLLINRSLRSVYQQKDVNPYCIYIVDDNKYVNEDDEYSIEYPNLKHRIFELRDKMFQSKFETDIPEWYFHTRILTNRRTRGHSGTGAWNTGLYRAIKYSKYNYIAILDDDDEWDENYLRKCLDTAQKTENGKEVIGIIAWLTRIESQKESIQKITQDKFNKEAFYIGNPGFQGSNMFLRLREFLLIGGFDESMKSATDRDLGVRLCEYLQLHDEHQVKILPEPLINHYAISNNRTTSSYKNKKQGLDVFYRKYINEMSKEVREKSFDRARKLFDYKYEPKEINHEKSASRDPNPSDRYNLIIGMMGSNGKTLKEFLLSFRNLPDLDVIKEYRIYFLENSDDEYEIRPILKYFKDEYDINIELIEYDTQDNILDEYPFPSFFDHVRPRSIPVNRSMVHWIIRQKGKEIFDDDCVYWIIDDDNMLNNLEFSYENLIVKSTSPQFLSRIQEMKSEYSVDAYLGGVNDAPPLPFLSSIRTQCLDLMFNLKWFVHSDPLSSFCTLKRSNIEMMRKVRDYYYDLSSQDFQHLEYPFWWFPVDKEVDTVFDGFKEFLEDIIRLAHGTNVFRPLYQDNQDWGEVTYDSIYRGGNTIVVNPELLLVPNITAKIENKSYNITHRRSDFIWAMINKELFGATIKHANLPLRHHRRLQSTTFAFNIQKLSNDIHGLVLYRSLDMLLKDGKFEYPSLSEIDDAISYYKKKFTWTLKYLEYNCRRAEYLVNQTIGVLDDVKHWWYTNQFRGKLNDKLQLAISSLKNIKYQLGKRRIRTMINKIKNDWNKIDRTVYIEFFEKLEAVYNYMNGEKLKTSS